MPTSPDGRGVHDDGASGELVEVAYANDPIEAEMIQGLLETGGIRSFLQPVGLNGSQSGIGASWAGYGRGPRRIMAHVRLAEKARTLLAETFVENEQEAEPEIANARYLDEARGRKSQGHGLLGAYGRIYLWSLGTLGVAFAIFLLLRTG